LEVTRPEDAVGLYVGFDSATGDACWAFLKAIFKKTEKDTGFMADGVVCNSGYTNKFKERVLWWSGLKNAKFYTKDDLDPNSDDIFMHLLSKDENDKSSLSLGMSELNITIER